MRSKAKSSRRPKRWTLMFIGDHGKIISIKRFKGYAFLLLLLLLLEGFCSVGFYYLYQKTRRSNESLKAAFENMQHQIKSLKDEKDTLMARLVVAEANLDIIRNQVDNKSAQQVPENIHKGSLADENKPAIAIDEKKVGLLKASPGTKLEIEDQRDTSQSHVPLVVAVEDLKVTYELKNKTYEVKFIIRNIQSNSDPIAGYTVVVLRNNDMSPDEGLTFPKVNLVSGRPAGNKMGQYFSIARFKTVQFQTTHQSDPKQYTNAIVFVFDSSKNLLLEKALPIRVEEISSASK